jgi:GTP-binding protein EngB required for normal cell division
MNPFNVNNEIKNLNNIVNNIKTDNTTIQDDIHTLNHTINDVQLNKPDKIEIINLIDEIKDEIIILNSKVDKIMKKQFLVDYNNLQSDCDAQKFLTSIGIEKHFINTLIFLDYKTIEQLLGIDQEELIEYGIPIETSKKIIVKVKETITTFI